MNNFTDITKTIAERFADGFNGVVSFKVDLGQHGSSPLSIIIKEDEEDEVLGRACTFQIELNRPNIVDVCQTLAHELGHWVAMAIGDAPLVNDWAEELTAHLVGQSIYGEADWTPHIDAMEYELEEEEIEEARIEAEKRIATLSDFRFSLL